MAGAVGEIMEVELSWAECGGVTSPLYLDFPPTSLPPSRAHQLTEACMCLASSPPSGIVSARYSPSAREADDGWGEGGRRRPPTVGSPPCMRSLLRYSYALVVWRVPPYLPAYLPLRMYIEG
jgi:hypothetical protein